MEPLLAVEGQSVVASGQSLGAKEEKEAKLKAESELGGWEEVAGTDFSTGGRKTFLPPT